MANRRQQLLSQLKNNLDIVSRAIGLDKNKPSSAERPAEPARFESDAASSVTSYNAKDQDFNAPEIDLRFQGPNRAPLFPTDHYSRSAAPNNGSAGIRDDIRDPRPSYDDQYSMHHERTTLFPTSANDIDSEDAFLYGSRLPEPKPHMQASGYSANNSKQVAGDDLMDKINFLLHGGSASAKKLPVTSEEMQVDQYLQQDYPKVSVAASMYSEAKRTDYPPSAASQDSDETVDRILKTIGLDGRISDMVQGLIRKDPRSARPSQALTQHTVTPPMSANSTPIQMPPITSNSSSQQINWDRATQQFLNKMSYASMGEMPREHELPFAFQYPPPPNWNNQKETKLPDSSGGLETRLYFKAKPEGTALPGLNYRQNDSSAGRALSETLSNIKALEEALASLNQSKTSLMLRPPGSQRDSMMLENMRTQEELSGQILALRDTARELSQQMKNQTPSSSTQQSDSLVKNSPTTFASQPSEEPPREPSTSKHSDRISTDRKSRSRSHSRDKKKNRSRSRSRDRKRTRSRRYSRSRSRSRDGYRRRNRNRSRSRDRSRSRERRRSRDRMLSDADRKALGFGTSARKALEAKTVAQKAEDKEKKALELALSMYVGASEYYNGTNIWCQKCDVIFNDVFGLCQHLHSEMHQSKVDPDFNKPRPSYAPVIPPGVPSAPSRGYEFVLPLQAFFCSLCCEFSKDINKAEEHVKSVEHNKKFKQFINDNSSYELKFLKDVMMAIARAKVPEEPAQPTESKTDAGVTDAKKYSTVFLNPEDDSKRETREKFQIKFTGALKQGSSKVTSRSPDVEVIKVTPGNQKDASDDTKKTSASTSATSSNIIVSKMIGLAKKPPGKSELPRPSGWVLKADAHVRPPALSFPKNAAVSPAPFSAKNSLQNDKPKGPTLDIFSPDSPKMSSTPFSKLPPSSAGGKSAGGRLQTTSMTTNTSTGSAKKSEEAVLNIGDFEIFDEC